MKNKPFLPLDGTSTGLLAICLIATVAFSLAMPGRFLTENTFLSIAFQLPELGLLTFAMFVPMLSGGLNLSIIVTANLTSLFMAWLLYAIMEKAVRLAQDLGIRTIQLAGYDVYYEPQDDDTIARFEDSVAWAVELAAGAQVMCAVEIMDTPFMNSISKWQALNQKINSPWFTVYPDIGNLSAWGNEVDRELTGGINRIAAIHLKDTLPVTPDSPGQFRDVPFGEGCVDFVQFFKTLRRLNYRGTFLIEMWTEKADEPLLEIIRARQWIEDKMAAAGWGETRNALLSPEAE